MKKEDIAQSILRFDMRSVELGMVDIANACHKQMAQDMYKGLGFCGIHANLSIVDEGDLLRRGFLHIEV